MTAQAGTGDRADRRRPSLTRQLLAWTVGSITLVWLTFIAIGFYTGVDEADELTDGHLASTAALLLNMDVAQFAQPQRKVSSAFRPALKRHDYQQSLSVVIWSADGLLLTRTGDAPLPRFDAREGFFDLQLGQPTEAWRAHSQWDEQRERLLMVLLSVHERNELAKDIARDLTETGLWLLPVVTLVLGLAVRRGLRPLYELSEDVARLDVARAERLKQRPHLREFDSVVRSINQLIASQQAAMERERQLAGEVAHELRTPLASIALQAGALAGPLDAREREEVIARIGHDALRAGHVLNQLLALARASRAELAQSAVELDLADLARRVAGDFAQAAWERGDTLAVTGSAELPVRGHPLLLELALRNLVDNAIRHTGTGANIEVSIGRDGAAAWFAVFDDGGASGAANAESPAPGRTESLGLGLKIVERVADLHSALFLRSTAPAPFCTGFRFALDAQG